MIRFVRRFAAVFLASLAIALPARATTFSVDFTDIWWNALEDGWGVTVSQQGDIIFATFFIYGPDSSARWFSAALFPVAGSSSVVTFSGDLFRSSGSFYGDPNFRKLSGVKAGTATMTFNSAVTGTLMYNIDGVSVTKQITRQTFRNNNLAGRYVGGMVGIASNCRDVNQNGYATILGNVIVTQTDPTIVMEIDFFTSTGAAAACTFRGSYTPLGRVGTISNGTWTCVVGSTTTNQGTTFSMTNIDGQANGFHATFTGTDQFCNYNGRFGGVRDAN